MSNRKIYTFEEAYKNALIYFGGDELAAKVYVNKYALKDSYGRIYENSPIDTHWRIAYEVERIEQRYANPLSAAELYEFFDRFRYIIPGGGVITGVGNPYQISSLSNCFAIGLEGGQDSYGSICKIDEEQIHLMKRRGGVGHDISHIRPKGSPVKNSALTSTGLVPFMERYSNTTREVAQDGRRGALMLSVSIKHPDSESFIDAKMIEGKVTGANVSVRIDDAFMQAVVDGTKYTQQYPIDAKNPTTVRDTDATELWKKIVHNAWKSAEPGVLFWDTIIRESLPDCYADEGFRTITTNPCGEIPLCAYDSCRLLALNLYSYVINPFTEDAYFDFDLFREHVRIAQRIQDDIIDLEIEKIDAIIAKVESDPEDEEVRRTELLLWQKVKDKAIRGRRTGTGITAEGDMIAAMGFRYGTEAATEFAVKVHKELAVTVYKASVQLAKERGAFPIWNKEKEANNPFINRILAEFTPEEISDYEQYGRRNIACLTIAPTGTLSIMTQSSSGIEPAFKPVYKRRRKINTNDKDTHTDFIDEKGDCWEEYIVFHHKFQIWMETRGYVVKERYEEGELEAIIELSPYHKATSDDVDWLQKVRMQGRVQQWIDHSISVTINLPEDTPEELINTLYVEAWRSGCKGATVYCEGSRAGVMVSATKKEEKSSERRGKDFKRPAVLEADIFKFTNNKEKWIAVVGLVDGIPYEIFTGVANDEDGFHVPDKVKTGKVIKTKFADGSPSDYTLKYENNKGYAIEIEGLNRKFNSEFWNYAKMISGVLRYEMPIDQVVKLVQGLDLNTDTINTWKNGIERILKKYISDGTIAKGEKCPKCGADMMYTEGCKKCSSCEYTLCGA